MKTGKILGTLGVCGIGAVGVSKYMQLKNELENVKKVESKVKRYNLLLTEWLSLKQRNEEIVDYFEKNNFKKIAIYGMGTLGWRLLEDLKDTEIEVVYAIDQEAEKMGNPIKMYTPDSLKDGIDDDIDVIVISAIADYNNILCVIEEIFDVPIISLEDVIFKRL